MNDYGRLARRSRHTRYISLPNEGSDHLDTKIDRHDTRAFVVVEEDVVPVGPQAGMPAEESPHAVERRFECSWNILYLKITCRVRYLRLGSGRI